MYAAMGVFPDIMKRSSLFCIFYNKPETLLQLGVTQQQIWSYLKIIKSPDRLMKYHSLKLGTFRTFEGPRKSVLSTRWWCWVFPCCSLHSLFQTCQIRVLCANKPWLVNKWYSALIQWQKWQRVASIWLPAGINVRLNYRQLELWGSW